MVTGASTADLADRSDQTTNATVPAGTVTNKKAAARAAQYPGTWPVGFFGGGVTLPPAGLTA